MSFRDQFHHKHCAKNAKLNMENVRFLGLLLRGQLMSQVGVCCYVLLLENILSSLS